MIVVKDTGEYSSDKPSVITIGTFDGLHVGHKKIITELLEKSKELNCKSIVITFEPHPRTVVSNDFDIKILTTINEKKKVLSNIGIDKLYIINFTKEFSKQTYKEFVQNVIVEKNNAQHIIVGYDHKFGKDRDGDKNNLLDLGKEKNIGITVVGAKEVEDTIISSTKIRKALLKGDIEFANKMLGRSYSLSGKVVEGSKRGRTLGFPTANLEVEDKNKLIPQNGVYFVEVEVDSQKYYGVLNVGLRPTFNNRVEPIAEVHILEFENNIYGKKITIDFIQRLRDEKKFASVDELKTQITEDIKEAKKLIKNINN
ncbi:MAG: bifunctional riboflavin kinase/FAD synthetase [Ignavibacteriae bacterium]|nr:bifunctional riboflavin kinase/FAD synthetase [Ignavibacteriota bacterium]